MSDHMTAEFEIVVRLEADPPEVSSRCARVEIS